MKIGISTLFYLKYDFSLLIKKLKSIKVEYIELVDEGLHSLNYRRVKMIKNIIEENKQLLTVHAPFVDVNIASPFTSVRKAVLRRLIKSIKLSSKLGSKLWIFHPGLKTGVSHIYPGVDWKIQLESVKKLNEIAKHYKINIAIENGPEPFPFLLKSVKDFLRFYSDYKNSGIGLTLDVAHANLNNQILDFINAFSKKIVHAHLHDNNADFDYHLGVGNGNIKWVNIIRAFKDVKYSGIFIIESENNVMESIKRIKTLLKNRN